MHVSKSDARVRLPITRPAVSMTRCGRFLSEEQFASGMDGSVVVWRAGVGSQSTLKSERWSRPQCIPVFESVA